MQKMINIHQAKTHLSRLLQRVASGEEIVIAKAGKPIAMLVPIEIPRTPRVAGSAAGKIMIADDFDAALPDEILKSFEG
jgi:prevent-host-death family protein